MSAFKTGVLTRVTDLREVSLLFEPLVQPGQMVDVVLTGRDAEPRQLAVELTGIRPDPDNAGTSYWLTGLVYDDGRQFEGKFVISIGDLILVKSDGSIQVGNEASLVVIKPRR